MHTWHITESLAEALASVVGKGLPVVFSNPGLAKAFKWRAEGTSFDEMLSNASAAIVSVEFFPRGRCSMVYYGIHVQHD